MKKEMDSIKKRRAFQERLSKNTEIPTMAN